MKRINHRGADPKQKPVAEPRTGPENEARHFFGRTEAEAGPADHRQLLAIVNASRDAIWSWDEGGTIVFWNLEAERLFQYAASEIVGQSIFALIPPERHDRAREALACLGKGDWFGQYETERVRKDGTRIQVELTVSPILDVAGRVAGAATICRDITGRKQAEWERGYLAAIVDSSEDAIIAKDLDGIITTWNGSAERLFGYPEREVVGKSITIIIPDDRLDEETRILGCLRRGEHVPPYDTVRRRKDGSLVDISLTVSPVQDAEGRIIGASKIARDISERKRAERLRRILTRELNHRAKNTLAIVQSIANRTFSDIPEASDGLAKFRGRLHALSVAHDLLIGESWQAAPLTTLIEDVLDALGESARVTCDGPEVTLEAGPAVTTSMAVHELATNAVKHGALSKPEGTVAITWTLSGGAEPRLRLTWQERGGPPVSPPERRGFGRLLLERMLSQHLGEVSLDFRPDGLVCVIMIPLASGREEARALREGD